MKLTPEQRKGIEERFAVLAGHVVSGADGLANDPPEGRPAWRTAIVLDIWRCRDEVITLVERLECEPRHEPTMGGPSLTSIVEHLEHEHEQS